MNNTYSTAWARLEVPMKAQEHCPHCLKTRVEFEKLVFLYIKMQDLKSVTSCLLAFLLWGRGV